MVARSAQDVDPPEITHSDRLKVLQQYRLRISDFLNVGDLGAALSTLFDLDEEWGRRFERRLIRLSKEYGDFVAENSDAAADSAEKAGKRRFVRRAQTILDAIERTVLDEIFEYEHTDEGQATGLELDLPDSGPARTERLSDLKKRLQATSLGEIKPVVRLDNVGHIYANSKDRFHLKGISQEIRQGQIIALVGGNGTGKTTLLRIIAAELKAASGTVSYPGLTPEDESANGKTDWARLRQQIAFIPAKLDAPAQKVMTLLQMTGLAAGLGFRDSTHRTQALIHRYGLAALSDTMVSQLSSGERLRFELARTLLVNPTLIVLDEPLANLDVQAQSTLLSDLRSLASSVQQPRAVVVSSHHIRLIEAISDTVIHLKGDNSVANEDAAAAHQGSVFRISVRSAAELGELAQRLSASGTRHGEEGSILIFDRQVPANEVAAVILDMGLDLSFFQDLTGSAEVEMLLGTRTSGPRQDSGDAP